MYSNSPADRTVISFECPAAEVKSFCDDLEDGLVGGGTIRLPLPI